MSGNAKGQAGDAANFVESLGAYSRQHRAKHWAGTFEDFIRDILPALAPRTRTQQPRVSMGHAVLARPQQPGRAQRSERALPARAVRHRRAARARRRLLQGRGRRLRRRTPPAAAARTAVGRQVDDGHPAQARHRGIQPHRRGRASTRSPARRCTSRRSTSCRRRLRADFREKFGVEIRGEPSPWARDRAGARVRRRFPAHARGAGLPVGGLAGRRRHLRAARPLHCRHRRPRGLGRPVEGRRSTATRATRAPGRGPARSTPQAAACSR